MLGITCQVVRGFCSQMYETEERTCEHICKCDANLMDMLWCVFNNEDLDASALGLSAPGYRSLFM